MTEHRSNSPETGRTPASSPEGEHQAGLIDRLKDPEFRAEIAAAMEYVTSESIGRFLEARFPGDVEPTKNSTGYAGEETDG